MFITPREILDIVIMIFAIGYIFSNIIKREPTLDYDPLKYYAKNQIIENIKFGAIIAAPAVVLHELSHKIAAMSFGAVATLHAPIGWYAIIIVLQMLKFPFLFFVGGYVSHTPLPALQSAIVAFAGPLMNIIIYGVCVGLVKYKLVAKKHYRILLISAKLNLFLLIFNMIPIPGFDGYSVFNGLIKFLF